MRVLELLETLLRRPSPPALLLLLPRPLLRVLGDAAGVPALRPLLERASGLIRHRVCKLSVRGAWPEASLPAARLLTELEGVLAFAAKARGGGAPLAAATTDVVMLLLRTITQHKLVDVPAMLRLAAAAPADLQPPPTGAAALNPKQKRPGVAAAARAGAAAGAAGVAAGAAAAAAGGVEGHGSGEAALLALLRSHVRSYYNTKNCRLSGRLVTELLQRFPLLGWCVAPLLVGAVRGPLDVGSRVVVKPLLGWCVARCDAL